LTNSVSVEEIILFYNIGTSLGCSMIWVESILGSGAYRNSFRFFQDAAVRMENTLGCSPMDITKFSALGQRAQDVALVNLKKDEDYDDAPDEFIG